MSRSDSGVGLRPEQIVAAPNPLYFEVYSIIADAVKGGQLKPGDRLPTERAFCERFGVSRATVRRALRRLADEGLVSATVGRGSFVINAPFTEPPNVLMSFSELAVAGGFTATAQVLDQKLRPATPEEASVFQIDVTSRIFELERVRMLDGEPVAIDRSRMPLILAPNVMDQDFTDASIYAVLDSAGVGPTRGNIVVSAAAADSHRATALGVREGTPLLVCTTMSLDESGRLVEIGEMAYRADRYQFRAMLARQSRTP